MNKSVAREILSSNPFILVLQNLIIKSVLTVRYYVNHHNYSLSYLLTARKTTKLQKEFSDKRIRGDHQPVGRTT